MLFENTIFFTFKNIKYFLFSGCPIFYLFIFFVLKNKKPFLKTFIKQTLDSMLTKRKKKLMKSKFNDNIK